VIALLRRLARRMRGDEKGPLRFLCMICFHEMKAHGHPSQRAYCCKCGNRMVRIFP